MPREIRVHRCQLSERPVVAQPGIAANIPGQGEDYSLVRSQGKSPLRVEVDHHRHVIRKGDGPLQRVGDMEASTLWFVLVFGPVKKPSLRDSGRSSSRSTYFPVLMGWTRCAGMGANPDMGRVKSASSCVVCLALEAVLACWCGVAVVGFGVFVPSCDWVEAPGTQEGTDGCNPDNEPEICCRPALLLPCECTLRLW